MNVLKQLRFGLNWMRNIPSSHGTFSELWQGPLKVRNILPVKLFIQSYLVFNVLKTFILHLFSHLADAFIQSDLQMRTMEAIQINKRAMIESNIITDYLYLVRGTFLRFESSEIIKF